MKPLVYLAGPIAGHTYDAAIEWRDIATSALGWCNVLSPLRDQGALRSIGLLPGAVESCPYATARTITHRDRFDVQRCDVMLVNFIGATEVSKGTMIELGWADAFRKPIVVVMDDGNPNDHPMVRELASIIVPDLEGGIEAVLHILAI